MVMNLVDMFCCVDIRMLSEHISKTTDTIVECHKLHKDKSDFQSAWTIVQINSKAEERSFYISNTSYQEVFNNVESKLSIPF